MDKKLLVYICITAISIIAALVFGVSYYNPENYIFPDGHDFRQNTLEKIIRTEHSLNARSNAPIKKLIGGICAFALLGYLLVICLQKLIRDDKADSVVSANALHTISLKSGRTEYELFVKAAEEWSISKAQIDKDFRDYMGANVLPYYVMDLVRKNNEHISDSIEKKEEKKHTSRWDLVRALLIFPGCFLIFFFLIILLPKW